MCILKSLLKTIFKALNIFLFSIVLLVLEHSHLIASPLDNSDQRYPQRQYRRFLLPNQMMVLLILLAQKFCRFEAENVL